jgi:class 3 adenylate cyclase
MKHLTTAQRLLVLMLIILMGLMVLTWIGFQALLTNILSSQDLTKDVVPATLRLSGIDDGITTLQTSLLETSLIEHDDNPVFTLDDILGERLATWRQLDDDWAAFSAITPSSLQEQNLSSGLATYWHELKTRDADLTNTISQLGQNPSESQRNILYQQFNQQYEESRPVFANIEMQIGSLMSLYGQINQEIDGRVLEKFSSTQNTMLLFSAGVGILMIVLIGAIWGSFNRLTAYFSPKLAERLIADHELSRVKGKNLTILFVDIRGFTKISDEVEPEVLLDMLNEYFERMSQSVLDYGGTVGKFVGDTVMGFFGDSDERSNHAELAVRAALEMQSRVNSINENSRFWKTHRLEIGIGINTGSVMVGNVGSERHKDYTVIGRQVNLASRLTKDAKPGQTLISSQTFELISNSFKTEVVGHIIAKGFEKPILAYDVLGLIDVK